MSATVGLVVYFVLLALAPGLPINPYPPPTPVLATSLPSAVAVITIASTPTPSPVISPTATHAVRVTPTPLRPATSTPTAAPTVPFGDEMVLEAPEPCTGTLLAGTVIDQEGEHLEGYPVHVWGRGLDVIAVSGEAPERGPSGWEVVVGASGTVTGTWYVQLHEYNVYHRHLPLSRVVSVVLPQDCEDGVTMISFVERRMQ